MRSGKARLLLLLLLVALAPPPLINNARIIPVAFTDEIPRREREPDFFQLGRGFLYPNLKDGCGVISYLCGNLILPSNVSPRYVCQEPTKRIGPFPNYFGPYHKEPGYRGEAYFLSPRGEAKPAKIGFNRIEILARALAPDILIVNFAPGWCAGGMQVGEGNGLLAVALRESGEYRIILRYRAPGLYCGVS